MDWLDPAYFTQYFYDPYGNIVAIESHGGGAFGNNAVAHQGLFFDRFTANPAAPVLRPFTDDLTAATDSQGQLNRPISFGVCQNRNRVYSPLLGRFLQRDPNETGIALWAMVMKAMAPAILVPSSDSARLYSDGMNLYQYARSNPLNMLDPMGWSIASKLCGIDGGPYYTAPGAIGYAMGMTMGMMFGYGPSSYLGMVAVMSDPFGPAYLPGDVEGIFKWLAIDVAPELFEKQINQWGKNLLNYAADRLSMPLGQVSHGLVAAGAGLTALAGIYTGIIDSVMYTVESEMYGSTPSWGQWPWE